MSQITNTRQDLWELMPMSESSVPHEPRQNPAHLVFGKTVVSVFTADIEHGCKVAAKIDSGMVFIDQPVWTAAQLPFGGIKNSGFGREPSELGFGEFVNEKLINVAPPGSPPWGPFCDTPLLELGRQAIPA
jgi:Aldehyde dehydrogenase family